MMHAADNSDSFFWLYGGINFSYEGNGGPECAAYLSPNHRIVETVVILLASVIEIAWSMKRIKLSDRSALTPVASSDDFDKQPVNGKLVNEKPLRNTVQRDDFKIFLLVLVTMAFGIEIGYKFATNSLIYLLNPCHMLTFSLIYLLSVDERKQSRRATTIFRIHLHLLSGALLAILLPVVNTRFLSFEKYSYWLHHLLIYFIPGYLLSVGGPFTAEPLSDPWWPILSVGVGFFYHFTCLQSLSLVTYANLNNMLCPALTDPFAGSYYRIWAFAHQHVLVTCHGKLYQLASYIIGNAYHFMMFSLRQTGLRLCKLTGLHVTDCSQTYKQD